MYAQVYHYALLISQVLLLLSCFFAFLSLIKGPRALDRILSFDVFYNLIMILLLSFSLKYHNVYYLDVALIFALLGFVSSMALAKFLVHGEIIDGEVIEKEQDLRQEKILKECVQEMEN